MNKSRYLAATIGCLLAGAAAAQSGGGAANPEASASLGEIVVTAQRREQAINEVPQPVQAVSGAELQAMGVGTLEDSIRLIPSATSGAAIGAGSTTFQIRGVAASETDGDATVGYYLDNFAFSMPGRPYAPVADFYDMQRVEVLRGPSGTLYGLGSLGGTIKVLTNDPNTEELEGSLRGSLSDTSGGDTNYSGDAMINVPIVEGRAALRGVVSYKRLGGYADIVPSGEKNGNAAKSFTGRLKLLAKPTDNLLIRLSYWRNKSEQKFSNRITFIDPPRLDQTFGEANSDYDLISGDIELDLGFATVSSSTGYIKNTVISNNGGFIPLPIGNFISLWPLVAKNFNQDLRLTSNGDGPIRYIVGVFYQDGSTKGGQSVKLPDFAIPGNVGIETNNDNKLSSKSWAVYGEVTYGALGGKLDLTVGGRYFEERRRFEQNSSLVLNELGVTIPTVGTNKAKNNTFNPRFNVAWHVNDDGLVYVEAAKGFRSGAITSQALIDAANAAIGTSFSSSSPPDTLWNYAAGLKWALADGTVNVDVAAYYFDWKNAQLELSPALQTIIAPTGDVRGRGIDAAIAWRTPLDGLTLQVSGNVNKTELKKVSTTLSTSLPWVVNGAQLPGSAKNTFAISASYDAPLGSSGYELRTNAMLTHRAKQQSIFNGAYAPSIDLLSARIGLGMGAWTATLFGDNLTNEVGPISRPGGQNVIPFPRTVGVSLEYKF
jgi:iron complex outermembrane receptor protein